MAVQEIIVAVCFMADWDGRSGLRPSKIRPNRLRADPKSPKKEGA